MKENWPAFGLKTFYVLHVEYEVYKNFIRVTDICAHLGRVRVHNSNKNN
jgi:hypothetical protein